LIGASLKGMTAEEKTEKFFFPWRKRMRKLFEIFGWLAVLLLILVGMSSLFGRVGFMINAFSQEVADPEAVFNAFDIRYFQHFVTVWSHLILGFVVLVCAPFQFIPVIRKRWISFHRWNGRVWLICGAITAFTGAFIGIVWPFTGHQGFGLVQTAINALIGPYTLFCLFKAYSSIRARNFGSHREFMIRSFALMLGVASQRVLTMVIMPLTGLGLESVFGPMMALGMAINILASEIWIRLTRTPGNGNRHWRELDAI
jgi:uncharacterized membrane protein